MALRSIFLWTMIVSLTLAAAMGILAILFPGYTRLQEEILVTSLLVGLFSLPALACAVVNGKKRLIGFMWVGIASALIALPVWLILVWVQFFWPGYHYRFEDAVANIATPFTVLTALASHTGMLMLLRVDRPPFRAVRLLTIVVAAFLGAVIIICIWYEIFEEWMGKTIAVLSILGACGTIVTPILALVEALSRRSSRETIPSRVTIDLVCPRCARRQLLPAGTARCVECGLRIDIEVEEPRCACGYLLYQLKGDVCPECGRPVRSLTPAS